MKDRNARYLFTAAAELGLPFASQNPSAELGNVPTTPRKRTASGSTPGTGTLTPVATRINPPRLAKHTPPHPTVATSPLSTPRGRPPKPPALAAARADPSPTPRPRKTPPNPRATLTAEPMFVEKVMGPPQVPRPPPQSEDRTSTALLQAILDRLEALERREVNVMRPPPLVPTMTSRTSAPSTGAPATVTEVPDDSGFIPVERNKKKRKGAGKTGANPTHEEQPAQINLTPASYAKAASKAANLQQGTAPAKPASPLPGITEVTVIRAGGHKNPLTEQRIRTRAADAIVREVRLNIAKVVAKPIPLRAGRWSIGPHSKGNFVFSFDGCIPFNEIMSYERILLDPFQGSGQLRPSLGWTRLLVHGVPVRDNGNDVAFGPDALLSEVRMLPGLKSIHFAMEPRWLKPIGEINSTYSTITFAISDPDGAAASTLFKERTALFGKEVTLRKWIDKPALVQCSRCHALGHMKTSKACPLGRDSVKCHICGGAHKSEEHNQKCPRVHTVAGICDCKNYKCLNCQNHGHHCRDPKCPARERYRPRHARKTGRGRNKGKERAHEGEPDLRYLCRVNVSEGPSEYRPPTQEDFTRHMIEGMGNWREGWGFDETPPGEPVTTMEVDNGSTPTVAPNRPASLQREYSPSRPQSSAANQSLP